MQSWIFLNLFYKNTVNLQIWTNTTNCEKTVIEDCKITYEEKPYNETKTICTGDGNKHVPYMNVENSEKIQLTAETKCTAKGSLVCTPTIEKKCIKC